MLYRQVQSLPGSLVSHLMFYQLELGSAFFFFFNNFLKINLFYLFIFDCVGSSLLCVGFL